MFSTKNTNSRSTYLTLLLSLGLLLSGCSNLFDDDDDVVDNEPPPPTSVSKTFSVDVINLSNAQPFAPIAGVLHSSNISLFNIGETASLELENVAESGDISGILDLSGVDVLGNGSTDGITPPGNTGSFSLNGETEDGNGFYLSVLTMPVNTNDAFTGANSISLDSLEVGERFVMNTRVYDAGTEANSEAAGTIPGPADGGEGFNADRDDLNFVTAHQGVVTVDDGLATSVLTEQHRFDNPIARLVVTRTE